MLSYSKARRAFREQSKICYKGLMVCVCTLMTSLKRDHLKGICRQPGPSAPEVGVSWDASEEGEVQVHAPVSVLPRACYQLRGSSYG